MKKLFLLLLLFSVLSQSQEKMILTPKGYAAVVVPVSGMTAEQIKVKAKEWVQVYYKNPDQVLKAEIGNDLLRIDGFCVDCYKMRNLGMEFWYSCEYSIELGFKDGKYRFEITKNNLISDGVPVLYTYADFFKKDGTVKQKFQLAFDTMNESVNEISESLYNYITGKTLEEKSKW